MRKTALQKLTVLGCLGVLTATAFSSAALLLHAKADAPAGNASPTETLITPPTYEQYLPLSTPKDFAQSEDYTAVSDGNLIYIYDKLHETYRRYEHTVNAETTRNAVSRLEFSEEGDLYFLDASSYLYYLPVEKLSSETVEGATPTDFACSTFTIENELMYYTNVVSGVTQLSVIDMDDLDATKARLLWHNINGEAAIAYYDHALYYTDRGEALMKIDPTVPGSLPEQICSFYTTITSLAINAGELYCTDDNGNFYAYNFTALHGKLVNQVPPLASDETGGSVAVTSHGEYIYLIQNGSVRSYECGVGFTGFEISASSKSENRLNGAIDGAVHGEYLLTADAGNRRISVYSRKDGVYRTVPSEEGLLRLATDGTTIAAITETKALLYDFATGEPLRTFETFVGKPVGVAAVYGAYYLVTDNNYYYKLSQTADESTGDPVWGLEGIFKQTAKTPRLLTSDIYGNLYIAADKNIYRFTESLFMDGTSEGTLVCSDTEIRDTGKLLVDYHESVYLLKGNELLRFTDGSLAQRYPLGKALVYMQTADTPVTALAFGVEDNAAYITYNGNLTVMTEELDLPTVKTIDTETIDENVFESKTAEFSVVQTSENALLVAFDLATTKGADSFPYLFYTREKTPLTALKIGETSDYEVLAVFDKTAHEYTNYVVLKRYVTTLDASVYRKDYAEAEQTTGYLTNKINLYKFPYLTELLTSGSAPKNQAVLLVGEVTELDYDYYLIRYEDETGETQTGFIPMAYITHFNGAPPVSETESYGEGTADRDAVYRLAYLLLGSAAIALLTDFLILRKKKDD